MEAAVRNDLRALLAEMEIESPEIRHAVAERGASAKAAMEIRRMRLALKMTQEELANAAGIKQGQLSRYEKTTYHGQKIKTIARLASAVGWQWRLQLEPTLEALYPADSSGVRFEGTIRAARATFMDATESTPAQFKLEAMEMSGAWSSTNTTTPMENKLNAEEAA